MKNLRHTINTRFWHTRSARFIQNNTHVSVLGRVAIFNRENADILFNVNLKLREDYAKFTS